MYFLSDFLGIFFPFRRLFSGLPSSCNILFIFRPWHVRVDLFRFDLARPWQGRFFLLAFTFYSCIRRNDCPQPSAFPCTTPVTVFMVQEYARFVVLSYPRIGLCIFVSL